MGSCAQSAAQQQYERRPVWVASGHHRLGAWFSSAPEATTVILLQGSNPGDIDAGLTQDRCVDQFVRAS
jgi:hypothetical protein